MPSADEIDYLLEATRSSVKRFGGQQPSLSHLAQILSTKWDDEFAEVFGDHGAQHILDLLHVATYVGGEADVIEVLNAGVDRKAVITELHSRLKGAIADSGAHVAEEGSAPTSAPDEKKPAETESSAVADPGWPARTNRFIREITGRSGLVERDDCVDQIVGALGRVRSRVPIVVGTRGSGRTAVLAAAAAQLRSRSGAKVWGVDLAALGPQPENPLEKVFEDCESGTVLVIDDVDKLAALGTAHPNGMALRVIRAATMNPQMKLVLSCEQRFLTRLQVQVEDLFEDLFPIVLPPLSDAAVTQVIENSRADLETAHGVTFSPELIRLACLPPRSTDIRAQPGLGVERLDAAASRARVLAVSKADIEHLAGVNTATKPLFRSDDLRSRLSEHVHGQNEAIRAVSARLALTRARLDLRPGRPDGVFLFIGPTGVGKTKLASALSLCIFGSEDQLIRLDMSEYAHDWAVSRLVGPMPGYVGSTEPDNWLTTRVSNNPDCVVLLDEIEKAHPTVWNTFLQVFDAGRLTDSRGVTADFSNTIIVMTSNLGAAEAAGPGLGFADADDASDRVSQKIMAVVKERMAPELINRIDEMAVFNPLDIAAIEEIAKQELAVVTERLAESGWSVRYGPEVVHHLATTGYEPAYGARHLQRNIERAFLSLVASANNKSALIDVADGELVRR